VNEVGDRRGVEAELRGGNVGDEAGARGVCGIEELAGGAGWILLAGKEVLLILGREECGEVVIEPPGDARRSRVLEVDDGVLVASKLAFVEERAGAVNEAVVGVRRVGLDALAVKAREQRSRAGSIEAFVVVENANLQVVHSPAPEKRISGTV